MSNNEINKYIELYSQLVTELAGLHNTHIPYVKHKGRETGFATRKHLREIVLIAAEMLRQGRKVNKEEITNKRLAKIQKREEKKTKKKKNKNDLDVPK